MEWKEHWTGSQGVGITRAEGVLGTMESHRMNASPFPELLLKTSMGASIPFVPDHCPGSGTGPGGGSQSTG